MTADGALRFDPYAYETHEDPFPAYARLRRDAPVYRNDELGFHALSRYDDVRAALRDWPRFTSTKGITLEETSDLSPPMLIETDPPRHTELRALVSRAFTPRRVAEMEDRVRMLSVELLERMRAAGGGDLVDDFAAVVPMAIIADLLGVPESDRARLRTLSDLLVHREPDRPDLPPAGARAGTELAGYFDELIRARRRTPGDDLVSALLTAEEDGRRLDHSEVLGFCFLLIIAGNETTTKLIGNAAYWLRRNPDQRATVVADPERSADAVEETLRYDGSTQLMARVATEEVTLHGAVIPAGARVLLLLGSANRDERRWPDPDRFDLDRDLAGHLAFGFGPHHCLGAALARLETRVALRELLAVAPHYELDEAGASRVHSGNVRGFARLPVSLESG